MIWVLRFWIATSSVWGGQQHLLPVFRSKWEIEIGWKTCFHLHCGWYFQFFARHETRDMARLISLGTLTVIKRSVCLSVRTSCTAWPHVFILQFFSISILTSKCDENFIVKSTENWKISERKKNMRTCWWNYSKNFKNFPIFFPLCFFLEFLVDFITFWVWLIFENNV